jgi:TPR repeat protein
MIIFSVSIEYTNLIYKIGSVKLNADDMESYYNYVTILTEDNGSTTVDIPTAHKHANIVAAKGHTFGTYYFAAMNNYKIGAVVDSCDITNELYRVVSERSIESKYKYDLATKAYSEGNIKMSSLLFLELAEEGHLFAEINTGILFNNHNIFVNTTFNKMISHKYLTRAASANNPIALLYLGDAYYIG